MDSIRTLEDPEATVLALDIGGTYTKAGLVSRSGEIRHVAVMDTASGDPFEQYVPRLAELFDRLRKASEKADPLAMGVGAPNASSQSGMMETPPNFQWGDRIPIANTCSKLWELPVFLTNDANAAALGEGRFGAARGLTDFVTLTLGTGLGSGIVSGGRLLTGANGLAGELGHINVFPEGRQCNCGLKGCLETYASVTGIRRTVFELIANRREPSVLEHYAFEELTGRIISEAANEGDALALEAFDYTAGILGTKMADTVAHLDPEAFVISGGLSQAGAILLEPLKRALEERLFPVYRGRVRVLMSSYTSEQAVLGPAALAWEKLEEGLGGR
ncbi:ROK family protein [Robiginitalea sp. SC105]|uniref:ROK family protein n=1 Tax=Robiginitalea sp. SC105 TaxID=2762332 RepID=UPI00163A2572|nr:ROK family protein [Robiginitalea sp. SC105]MBC2840262.1 ROK family protein [Robiginitalea sp. SC105]